MALVWPVGAIGITLKLLCFHSFQHLSLAFYLAYGLTSVILLLALLAAGCNC
jgi:predicted membrane channel-forming protein YqfA (hemolysin III family)